MPVVQLVYGLRDNGAEPLIAAAPDEDRARAIRDDVLGGGVFREVSWEAHEVVGAKRTLVDGEVVHVVSLLGHDNSGSVTFGAEDPVGLAVYSDLADADAFARRPEQRGAGDVRVRTVIVGDLLVTG